MESGERGVEVGGVSVSFNIAGSIVSLFYVGWIQNGVLSQLFVWRVYENDSLVFC